MQRFVKHYRQWRIEIVEHPMPHVQTNDADFRFWDYVCRPPNNRGLIRRGPLKNLVKCLELSRQLIDSSLEAKRNAS